MREQGKGQFQEHPADVRGTDLQQRQVIKEFYRGLHKGQKAAARRNPELAAWWCRYAATIAWRLDSGIFYCPEMEQLLAEIGREYLGQCPVPSPSAEPPQRFLHVMSEAYETGGHTRAVFRWIKICAQFAPSERHSILISMQHDTRLPAWLAQSAEETGGEFIVLPPGIPLLQAAAELRSRSFEADVVILHIHPNDPLPNIAFHDRPRPILFFRHADHVFNLGLSVAEVFADLRPVGQAMSMRFCPSTARKVMLPIPLVDDGYIPGGKAEARRRLGLPADAHIAITVGPPHRFAPKHGISFSALVEALCTANPRTLVIAIGLNESDQFPGLVKRVGGRFMPVGVVRDSELLDLYYRAADIYLDPIPGGSGTSALDVALHGLPVERLYNPYQCLMWNDDPGLESVARAATTLEEYVATALEWLDWPEEKRVDFGSRFRMVVLDDHCGASWRKKYLEPAIAALNAAGKQNANQESGGAEGFDFAFPGLGKPVLESDGFAGMWIAGAVDLIPYIPWPLKVSGLFHSIKPLLSSSAADSTIRQRLSIFRELIEICMPSRIHAARRWVLRTFLRS